MNAITAPEFFQLYLFSQFVKKRKESRSIINGNKKKDNTFFDHERTSFGVVSINQSINQSINKLYLSTDNSSAIYRKIKL